MFTKYSLQDFEYDFRSDNKYWIQSGHIFDTVTDYFSFLGISAGYKSELLELEHFNPYSVGNISEDQAKIVLDSFVLGQILYLEDRDVEVWG